MNVPRLRRFPVFGFFLREYRRYSPDLSLRIIGALLPEISVGYTRNDARDLLESGLTWEATVQPTRFQHQDHEGALTGAAWKVKDDAPFHMREHHDRIPAGLQSGYCCL